MVQVANKYPDGIDKASGCTSISALTTKEDLKKLEQAQLMNRRRQMAAEFGFTKKISPVADRKLPPMPSPDKAALRHQERKDARHKREQAEHHAIVQPTHIADKYKNETSVVGVGEHYRRTHVNVANKSTVEKRAKDINVETLLGLSTTEKISDVVDPSVANHLTTKVTHTTK
jgi:hypothetical protein